MDTEKFIKDVEAIDWTDYKCFYYHNPQNISKSLIALVLVDKEENGNEGKLLTPTVAHDVLSAIGNNHAGTYYPVVKVALRFILQVALYGNNEVSRNCAINILYDIFFFTGSYETEKYVKNEIASYKDEFLNLSYIHDINSKLLVEFVECITEIQNENEDDFF